jgi:hypothetical protein
MNLESSKLNEISCISKGTIHGISYPNFVSRHENLDMWKFVQDHSFERDKINKFRKSYHNFLLALWNLVKPTALQRRHIILLQAEISDLEGLKFQSYMRRKVI